MVTITRIDVLAGPVDAVIGTIEPYRDGQRASWTCDLCEKVGDAGGSGAALAELLSHLPVCEAGQ